ncbi:MAG TPA: DUF362 domain-containing protein [Chitinivibrionales bacterium]|nr:DUF362 domain-containing protein [Chitinivibrionales bacterium]
MNAKKINRRKFLINSLEAAAGIGVLASCDKRTVVEPDIRLPAAPTGLSYNLATSDSGAVDSVMITWDRPLTDVTGAKLWTGIRAYDVYRDDTLLAQVTNPGFVDASGFAVGSTCAYTVRAVDSSPVTGPNGQMGNQSPPSDRLLVPIQKPSHVYPVTNATVNTGTIGKPNIQATLLKSMIDAAVAQMQIDNGAIPSGSTQDPAVATAAWESLFPGLTASSLIGIKVNTLGGSNVSTRPEVVTAIVSSLTAMLGGTFPAYQIIIFDDRAPGSQMAAAGFPLRNVKGTSRIASASFNTTLNDGVPVSQQEPGSALWGSTVNIAGTDKRLTAIFEAVDFLINVPVLKDHAQSGISFSMKNLYGITDIWNGPATLHDTMCSPSIPALYQAVRAIPNARTGASKLALIVGDALQGCFSGGPDGPPTCQPNSIVVGTDPVAIDTWALKTINALRAKYAPTLPEISWTQSTNPNQSDARHILDAAIQYNLGSTNFVSGKVSLV